MQKRFLYHDQLEAAAQQAEDHWRAGNWHGALGLYCQIFQDRWQDLQYEDRLTAADLTILERITDFAVPLGLAQECDTILVHVVAGYRRLGQGYWADRIQIKRVHLALNANHIDQACEQLGGLFGSPDFSIDSITQWEKAHICETHPQELPELLAQTWLQTGRLMHLQGQNRGALLCFNRGLGHSTASRACKMHLHLAVIMSLFELGELDEARGRLAALKPNLDPVMSPGAATAWYELSAKADLLYGEFGSALEHLSEVWKICREYSFVLPMLRSAMNLAQGLILLNQTIEASEILQHIHALAVARSQDLLAGQAQRLLDVAGVQLHGGLERASAVIDEQAATKRVETSDPVLFRAHHEECYTLAHFEDRSLAFYWYLGLRHWTKARRSLDRLEPFGHTDSKIIHARLGAMWAMLEYYDGNPAVADNLLHKTRDVFLEMKLKPERWQIQVLWNRCRERLGASAAERTGLAQENEALLESFGNSLPLRSRVTYFLDKATQIDEALASRVRKLQDLRRQMASAGFFARFRLRLALWKGLNDLLDEAYWQKEAHNSGLLDNAATPDPVRKRTPLWRRVLFNSPREATVAFLVFPDSMVGICRRWLSLDFWVSSMGKHSLRLAVGEWHRLIPKANPEEQDAVLRQIAEQLKLDQVLTRLPWHVRRLRILPDDILHGLPFAAIEQPSSTGRPRYLGDRFSISIAFQPEKRLGERRVRVKKAGKPLVVGVTVGFGHLPPLRLTREQIRLVQNWLEEGGSGCSTIFDESASAEIVCERLRNASLFHISCHGQFVHGEPERTGLLLKTAQGTQILNLPQLSKLRLEQLHHATLISCWGADNFILPGRWILSLPQVLWRAGARTILASLWEIEEDVAERFVKLFYENLREHSPDAALSRAQASMRKSGGKYRDVRQWAGFQVYGDPQPLRF